MAALAAIGIVTADIPESCRFYRELGLDVPEPPDGEDHFQIELPGGLRLMWDTEALIKQLDPDWRRPPGQAPPEFRFAVKLPVARLDRIGTFVERVRSLRDRFGPLRVVVQSARDDGLLAFLLGSLDADLEVAFDFRHPSWLEAEVPVRVN